MKALGVPQASLDSFSWEFRQGMTARAAALGDVGESAPQRWEPPFGTSDVHIVLVGIAPEPVDRPFVLAAMELPAASCSSIATSSATAEYPALPPK